MRKQSFIFFFCCIAFHFASAQTGMSDSLRHQKDSILNSKSISFRAMFTADSLKVVKEFDNKAKWEKLQDRSIYPFLKGSKYSGVIPVKNVTEIPDATIDYKILFELTGNNDSAAKEINAGMAEIARVINLHVASGIPAGKIFPVIIVHGPALHALKNESAYQKKYKLNNPNVNLFNDLVKMGAKFIACGQAMEFFEVKREELLPEVKVSLTAQTVLTHYQLKGYVLRPLY